MRFSYSYTSILPIFRNIFSDMSRTLFRNVSWSTKEGRVLFQALRTYITHPCRVFLLGVILLFFFSFASALHRFLFEFSTSSLFLAREDRHNDPLMENATVKEERLLSFTRTSSPATPFCTLSSVSLLLLPFCAFDLLISRPRPFAILLFFEEENPLSLLVARRRLLNGICFRFIKSRLYIASFANRCL